MLSFFSLLFVLSWCFPFFDTLFLLFLFFLLVFLLLLFWSVLFSGTRWIRPTGNNTYWLITVFMADGCISKWNRTALNPSLEQGESIEKLECAFYICMLLKYCNQNFCHLARETNKINISILLNSSYEF